MSRTPRLDPIPPRPPEDLGPGLTEPPRTIPQEVQTPPIMNNEPKQEHRSLTIRGILGTVVAGILGVLEAVNAGVVSALLVALGVEEPLAGQVAALLVTLGIIGGGAAARHGRVHATQPIAKQPIAKQN